MNVILLGAPGVGKGTCAAILSGKYGWPHVSTGNMLREAITGNTALGVKAKAFVDAGKLVPDELVTEMVKERLSRDDCKPGFLLDGYPRTVAQAKTLQQFASVGVVLNFAASTKAIIERLSGRRTCRKCGATYHVKFSPPKREGICDKCGGELYQRPDDAPAVVTRRLAVYEEQTRPLIDFYRNEGVLHDIDASFGMDELEKIIMQCDDAVKGG